MMQRTKWTRAAAVVLGSALLLVGCGDEGAEPDAGEGAAATPFVVGSVPDGYELVAAGEGERRQEWGNDSAGTDEPYLVLANGDQRVFLHAFGYEGLQGDYGSGVYEGHEADGWVTRDPRPGRRSGHQGHVR